MLTGELPASWGVCLPWLIEIDLDRNRLTGSIPDTWGLLQG